jgi:hypothetical protein
MGAPRKLAAAILRAGLRLAPPATCEWASAMLRELDFIPGEWAALLWALGSAAAIFRRAVAGWPEQLKRRMAIDEEGRMNVTGKRAIGFVSGVVGAGLVAAAAFGLLWLGYVLFPGLGLDHLEWTHWLTMIVIPEIIFIAAIVKLWRKRPPVAAGILLFALAVGVHVVVHLARR